MIPEPNRPSRRRSLATLMRGALGLVLLALMALSGLAADKPSVVLITVDTLRADRVSPYGYAPAQTPTLSAWAEEGVTFKRAVAQVPMTLPSHASILSGTYPMHHGLRDVVGRLREDVPLLQEWFKQQGYQTAAFVGASVLSSPWGLNRGFDHYDDEFHASVAGRVDLDRVERPAEEVITRALEWIKTHAGQPFLVWVHLFDPHDPYTPPEPFASRFKNNPYDGEVAYVDAQLARLHELLKARNLFDPSLIVFTADHGESLGEHKEQHHAFFIYEAALRIPLIIKFPGGRVGTQDAAGTRVVQQVRSVDIAPTIVQSLGGQVPAWMQGESVLGLVLGRRDQPRPAYAETHYPRIHFGWSPLFSLSNERYKYIEAPNPELYDLEQDPGETNNLVSGNQALANRMSGQLRTLISRYGAGAETLTDAQVDNQTLKQLQSLGYVGFSGGAGGDGNWKDLADPKLKIDVYNQLNEAISVSRRGQARRAVQLLEQVAATEPEMPIVHFLLGSEYLGLKWYLKAVEEFRLTLKYNPESSPARFNLAQAYARSGLQDKAIETARELIREDPTHFAARHQLATLLAKAGQLEEAAQQERRAIELSPDFADAYNNLGAYLFSLGRIEEAVEVYKQALKRDPSLLQLWVNLSLAYLRLQQFQPALEAARRAVELEPNASLAHFYMGQAYQGLGQSEKAGLAFRRAKQLNPQLEIPGS